MRIVLGVGLVLLAGLLGGGMFTGNAIYGANVQVDPNCHDYPIFSADAAKLTVASNPLAHRIDPGVYERVERVDFPARDGGVTVAGLYLPGPEGAPLIIAVHGFTGCKHHKHGLSVLGILGSEGYGVLAIDLREHGESTIVDGVAAFGSDEFNDVLGAYDYARGTLGQPRAKIGLWGESMGGSTALIANIREDLGPLFLDAPYADITTVLKDNADRASVPPWSIDLIVPSVQLLRGHDFKAASPIKGLVQHADQPIYWVHGTADETTGIHHAHWAMEVVEGGSNKTFYLPEGLGHVATLWDRPTEYRTALLGFFDQHLRD